MTRVANFPTVKALAAILDEAGNLLVQCDGDESFYRLPGGMVEFGETAAATVTRELREEYGISAVAGRLLAVVENRFQALGRQQHEIVLVHETSIDRSFAIEERFCHAEHDDIQLVWRELGQLGRRLVPGGLERILRSRRPDLMHLISEENESSVAS